MVIERTRYDAAQLRAFASRALVAAGVSAADADSAANVLVDSDLRGIESHGVARLEGYYIERIREGNVDPAARETIVRETPTSLVLDAHNGLGHPVSVRAMHRTVEKAGNAGCAITTVRNSNHFGIAGHYALLALDRDCIGIASTNSYPIATSTAGRDIILGTNPIAFAAPALDGDAFVLDMATSAVALGKLEIAKRLGQALVPGLAIDSDGHPTTDPDAGIAGALLPLGGVGTANGGHKGYGLALMVDILCAVLGGGVLAADMPPRAQRSKGAITSHWFMAIKIDAFRDVTAFKTDLSRQLRHFRQSPPAPGFDEVLVAGDPERRRVEAHERDGIGLDPVVVASLERVAATLHIDPPRKRSA